jgi:hypothetical protein
VSWVCSVCGEPHDERLLDIRMSLPDVVHVLDEEDRGRDAWISDDFVALADGRRFVRGLLQIPIPELETRFGYGLWVEANAADWDRLFEHWYDPEQAGFPAVDGALANELDPYGPTLGLRVCLQPTSADTLPDVAVVEADHPLARDQRAGITVGRAEELAAMVLHSP